MICLHQHMLTGCAVRLILYREVAWRSTLTVGFAIINRATSIETIEIQIVLRVRMKS